MEQPADVYRLFDSRRAGAAIRSDARTGPGL